MKVSIKNTLSVLAVLIIVILFSKTFYENWSQIEKIKFDLNLPLYILSTFIFLAVIFYWGALWNFLLKDLGSNKLSLTACFKIQAQAIFCYKWKNKLCYK